MYLIILILVLSVLRFFEISVFAELSWWWIAALMFLAVIWFEFAEKWLGLDKRREHDALQKAREQRVKKTFGINKKR